MEQDKKYIYILYLYSDSNSFLSLHTSLCFFYVFLVLPALLKLIIIKVNR